MSNENRFVGMDIGQNAIRVVDLSATREGFKVESLHIAKTKTEFTEDGSVVDYGELVGAIKSLTEHANYPNRPVVVALKGPAVIAKRLSVFVGNIDDFDEQFRWIVDQYAYIDQEDMAVDYKLIGASERYGYIDVVLIASKRDVLQDFISVTDGANIKLGAVEPEILALERMYKVLNLQQKGVDAILHVGVLGSLIMFMKNGAFMFCKSIELGGKHFTDMLQSEMGLSYEDAEKYKFDPTSHAEPAKVFDELKRYSTYQYNVSVDKAVKFYQLLGGTEPSRFIMSGAASQTAGLAESLSEKYNVDVEFMDPWGKFELAEGITVDPSERYTYNIALGLALYDIVW